MFIDDFEYFYDKISWNQTCNEEQNECKTIQKVQPLE